MEEKKPKKKYPRMRMISFYADSQIWVQLEILKKIYSKGTNPTMLEKLVNLEIERQGLSISLTQDEK